MGIGVAEGGINVAVGMDVATEIIIAVGAGETAGILHDATANEKTQNAKQRWDNLV